ncbi:hypothetical protein JTB14_035811 [Gonioctena quinquepunctata]|nr:hypothetical protein JTB14_035811 [Gonioctena quinquepunctata]
MVEKNVGCSQDLNEMNPKSNFEMKRTWEQNESNAVLNEFKNMIKRKALPEEFQEFGDFVIHISKQQE